uniref:Organic cation/carnitine transporter 7-like n=1 Tax=Rhizophora mucronata TaxID=61149 RepID=A0A2P2MQS8_RHIMU
MADYKGQSYTVDEALLAIGFGKFQYMVMFYAGMGWVAEAMEMMILSFVGPAVKTEWNLTSRQESLITTVVFAGMMVGAFSWGQVSDRFGRRRGYLVATLATSAAGLLSAFAPNYVSLLIARCFVGLGIGGCPVLFSYFLEFVPAPNRGTWMMVFSAFWTFGTIFEAGLAWIVMPRLGWRWLLGLSAVPSFILLVFYIATPESPRYLCLKGKKNDALRFMQKIAKINGKELPPGVLVADHELDHQLQGDKPPPEGPILKDSHLSPFQIVRLLLSTKLIRTTLLLWVIFIANAFSYYGLVLMTTELNNKNNKCHQTQEANSQKKSDGVNYKDVFITSFAEFPGLIISAIIIDRIGRKLSMAVMFFVCCVFMLPLVVHRSSRVTTALLFMARICITGTFSIIYIYAPEIYPTSVRSTGLGLASSMGRIGGMICPLVAVSLVQGCHQSAAVGLFVGVVFIAGIFVLLFPYETKGLDLMESITTTNYENTTSVKQEEP